MTTPPPSLAQLTDGLTAAADHRQHGRYEQAEHLLARLLADAERLDGPASLAAAEVHNDYGVLLKATGDYGRARAHYETALAIVGADRGGAPSGTLAAIHHNLAGIHFVLGDATEALKWARRGLAIRRADEGHDEYLILLDEGNLAPILVATGRLTEAEALLTRLIDRFTALLGPRHYEVAVALSNLGGVCAHRAEWAAAQAHFQRALELKVESLGPDHPDLIRTLINLAVVTEKIGDQDAAAALHMRALGAARRALPSGHPLRHTLEAW